MVIPTTRKRPNWLKATLEDVEEHEDAKGTFKESKKPKKYSSYVAYITKLIKAEPSTFKEVAH